MRRWRVQNKAFDKLGVNESFEFLIMVSFYDNLWVTSSFLSRNIDVKLQSGVESLKAKQNYL